MPQFRWHDLRLIIERPGNSVVIIVGDDGVPLRVREELAAGGVDTVSICTGAGTLAARAATAARARFVIGDPGTAGTWAEAGLESARSVGIFGPDDLQNLSVALLVGRLRDEVPIVVRMFAGDLSKGIGRMLGPRATVLSETEVAAPSFVQAALSGNTGQRVRVAGHLLEVREVAPDDPSLVVALCNADTPTEVLPLRDQLNDVVLGLIDPQSVVMATRGALPASIAAERQRAQADFVPTRRRAPWRRKVAASLRLLPLRARVLLSTIYAVGIISATVFGIGVGLQPVDAVYFTVTTMATVGYGDINLDGQHSWLKIYAVCLMIASTVLSAGLLAFITDMIISTRIERALGRFPKPRKDHVIVCGLGKAGSQIAMRLHELEVPCICVEQQEDAVGIAVARALEIPVVFADARSPGVLEELNIDRAAALLAVTNDDLANIQCGLAAKERNPAIRVVLRMFDADLAQRLDHTSGDELDLTRSVSALAAPAFSAALLGRPIAEPLPLSNVPLRVVDGVVEEATAHVGVQIRDLHNSRKLRVLAIDDRWRPRDDIAITPGMRISAVGTRDACEELFHQAP